MRSSSKSHHLFPFILTRPQDEGGREREIIILTTRNRGNSTAVEAIFKEPKKSLSDKWNDLPQGARIGVYAGGAAFAGIIIIGALFYFLRQRRRGANEAKAAALRAEQERLELQGLKDGGSYGGAAAARWKPGDADYSVAEVRDDGSVGEKAFASMGPRPDNSWPEEQGSHAAPLLGATPGSPERNGGGGGYHDVPPPRSASAAPQGYGYDGYGYGAPQSPPRSASAAPQGYGYGGPGYR